MRKKQQPDSSRFSFRPNLEKKEHRRAWEILQAVPDGQKNAFMVQAIIKSCDKEYLENTLRKIIREELKGLELQRPLSEKQEIPKQMLGFLESLGAEDD